MLPNSVYVFNNITSEVFDYFFKLFTFVIRVNHIVLLNSSPNPDWSKSWADKEILKELGLPEDFLEEKEWEV
jgi:hypothetical protein